MRLGLGNGIGKGWLLEDWMLWQLSERILIIMNCFEYYRYSNYQILL